MIYVLAYPQFEPVMAGRIARFRSLHEPERARLVPAHISLVFGLRHVQRDAFIRSCELVAEGVSRIAVGFEGTEIVHDPFEETHKLFLMCSAGSGDLVDLHERLYEGSHRSELHPAFPFRPHMTIATHADRAVIERLDDTAIGPFPISCTIHALEVVEFASGALQSLRTIPLRK